LQNPGDVEEQGPPCVIKSQAVSGCRKGLAWEPRDEQVKIRQGGRFDLLDTGELGMLEVVFIDLYRPFVDLGVANALEVDAQLVAGGVEPQLETPDTGEQRQVAHGGQGLPSGYDVSMILETEASTYELDLGAWRLRRIPKDENVTGYWAAARLRKDAEWIPFEILEPLEVGKPARFMLTIRNDGVRTIRTTTPVLEIR
jgi:hypothetical protein